ncbi:hypothetical protein [Photobacterium damselae]|uniref:hypothetical protein n=1 Tax=Photobacterium damselae TaxID=38293 RepID=UPI002F415F9F
MKTNILVGLISLVLSYNGMANTITISPGDSYIARMDFNIAAEADSTPHAGVCVGFFNQAADSYCLLPGSYSKDGISAKILNGNIVVKDPAGTGSGIMNFNAGGASCSAVAPAVEYICNYQQQNQGNVIETVEVQFFTITGSKRQTYTFSSNLTAIEVSSLPDTTPGVYVLPVSLSALDLFQWKPQATTNLTVVVRDITCTIVDQTVDMGTIEVGSLVSKNLDLGLSCSAGSFPSGASWTYSNMNYVDNKSNLENVTFKIKNSNNEERSSGTIYNDINELNDLTIEIDAKLNAKPGRLNIPLQFTLTYS